MGQTQEEITEMESDIRGLDEDLQVKQGSLKLAHTRLENRTMRPGMDLCRDEVKPSPILTKTCMIMSSWETEAFLRQPFFLSFSSGLYKIEQSPLYLPYLDAQF